MIAANIEPLDEGLAALEGRIRQIRRLLARVRDLEALNRDVPVLDAGARDRVADALGSRAEALRQDYDRVSEIYTAGAPIPP